MRKNLEKFGKTLGVLAIATEFLVKFLLKSFPIRSVGKLRPQSYDVGAHRRPIERAKRYIKDNSQGAHSQ